MDYLTKIIVANGDVWQINWMIEEIISRKITAVVVVRLHNITYILLNIKYTYEYDY